MIKAGFIGLGAMGEPMAGHLHAAGLLAAVGNRTLAKAQKLAEKFSDKELFEKNVFPWVGGSTLGSYFVSATSSHYDWAIKKLKAHRKNCK